MTDSSASLYRITEYGRHNHRIAFLLGGWNTKPWLYWFPAHILKANGYRVIVYTYAPEVFSPNVDKTVTSLTAIRDAILRHIASLKTEGHHQFSLIGFSLGATIAFMTANRSPEVTHVVVNLTGTGPAEAAWSWDQLDARFKQQLLAQNLTLPELTRRWASLAPVNNLDHLGNKQLLVYLAKHDQRIPYTQGRSLLQHLRQAGLEYQLIENQHLSHGAAGVLNLLRTTTYLKFLRQP
jgi:pimeloyl-ACP methyl ester carboxylesterase